MWSVTEASWSVTIEMFEDPDACKQNANLRDISQNSGVELIPSSHQRMKEPVAKEERTFDQQDVADEESSEEHHSLRARCNVKLC
jgi:hypothetical protein